MKVWLGDFDKLDAEELSKILEDLGISTKVKSSLEVDLDWYYYVEGRFSELKEKYSDFKEVFDEWGNYIEAIKSVLSEGIDIREFEEKVLDILLPERKSVPSISNLVENYNGGDVLSRAKTVKALEKFSEDDRLKILERFKKELEISILIRNILTLNDISFENGGIKGQLPEDPRLRVYMDIDEEAAEELKLGSEYIISLERANHLYASLVDSIKNLDKLKKICEERTELFELYLAANSVVMMLDKLKTEKKIDEFIAEISPLSLEGTEINISRDAIKDILHSLKKNRFIKIKGEMIAPHD